MVDRTTGKIICVAMGQGRCHDFNLFKRSGVRRPADPKLLALADSGYQGLQEIHPNTALPAKKSKKHPLDRIGKALNRVISSERVIVENIIRRLKVFRILGERYRNRQKRFGLRLHLIAGMGNLLLGKRSSELVRLASELGLKSYDGWDVGPVLK